MKTIHKKILPQYMDAVISGKKTFEIRKDEDDIQVGDIIILEEWEYGKYKNCSVNAEVTYVLRDCPEYGLMDGYCIIGLACSANIIYCKGGADAIEKLTYAIGDEIAKWVAEKDGADIPCQEVISLVDDCRMRAFIKEKTE